jgi:transcriptional regulator with XRE-family HTH domain
MTLAERLRRTREARGLSLDELAARAEISKTYLWELEKDVAEEKTPSAKVLLRIAAALSVTIADLLALPTVKVAEDTVELPPSLQEFRNRMQKLGTPLSDPDVRDLARTKFRGGQPQNADEWHRLYLTLDVTMPRKKAE